MEKEKIESRGKMEQKKWKRKKGADFFLLLLAVIFAAIGLIAYTKSGVTEFTTALSERVLAAYGAGIALCVLGLVIGVKGIKLLGYLALLYAFLESLCVQATYIANVFVSIDGNSFTTGFLVMTAASLLAVLSALAATLWTRKEEMAE